jgi:1-acyl-sn-glycerol-3-phosphate acyltransferase
MPMVGTFLRRLGAFFVERFELRAGIEDTHQLARLAAAGETCIFFPEGTFTRAPGLRPFHLGAFSVAVEAGRAVVPVALRGTRAVLRDEQRLPRRAPVVVHIGAPVKAPRAGNTFSATIHMRDTARRFILEYCGEPDLTDMPADDSIRCRRTTDCIDER